MRVQSLDRVEVFKILMVRPHKERDPHPLQPLPPLLNHERNSKELLIADVLIPLGWGQPVRIERTQVYLCVPSYTAPTPVLEVSTSTMNYRSESGWTRMGADVNLPLRFRKASSASGSHANLTLVEVNRVRGAAMEL